MFLVSLVDSLASCKGPNQSYNHEPYLLLSYTVCVRVMGPGNQFYHMVVQYIVSTGVQMPVRQKQEGLARRIMEKNEELIKPNEFQSQIRSSKVVFKAGP